jgi:hypothetical protein
MKEKGHTGGAETRDGRDRLTSSPKTSSKSRGKFVLGGVTKPSLICTAPVAFVLARVDTSGTEKG